MTTSLPRHRSMALSSYAYDLGVPLHEFLVRLHFCPASEAVELIQAGLFYLDGVALRDPALLVTRAILHHGSVATLQDQQVDITFRSDDNGLR